MKKYFVIISCFGFSFFILSCSKEKMAEKATEKISGKWEVTSWLINGEEILGSEYLNTEDSIVTQCGTKVIFHQIEVLKNETFNFITGGDIQLDGNWNLIQTDNSSSYANCFTTDSVYENIIDSKFTWEISDTDKTHLTITRPWKLYYASFQWRWVYDHIIYEIQKLNKDELILHGTNSCGGLLYNQTATEIITFKRVE